MTQTSQVNFINATQCSDSYYVLVYVVLRVNFLNLLLQKAKVKYAEDGICVLNASNDWLLAMSTTCVTVYLQPATQNNTEYNQTHCFGIAHIENMHNLVLFTCSTLLISKLFPSRSYTTTGNVPRHSWIWAGPWCLLPWLYWLIYFKCKVHMKNTWQQKKNKN